ncbi:MAG: hypothetical protein HY649_08795 [Acidobacteria bacterium]|nr:hypothetical protein [Acidobacteriota bacterium]
MAHTGIEATLKKIADTQLVHARLMETNERKWNKRFDASQGRMARLERRTQELDRGAEHLLRATEKLWRVAEAHERRLDDGDHRTAALQDEVRTMVASMSRLIKMLENFARGRKRGNGRLGLA